ncbi:hypothetical protein Tco_0224868, partial [Tanacetum coccineum]
GNLKEATTVRKAIALLRQAIGSSPEENTRTTKLESTRERMNDRIEVVMDKKISDVDWDELIHTEMVETVVEVEDLDLDCVHTEDRLHLHGVRVIQDMHKADQS